MGGIFGLFILYVNYAGGDHGRAFVITRPGEPAGAVGRLAFNAQKTDHGPHLDARHARGGCARRPSGGIMPRQRLLRWISGVPQETFQ